MLDLFYSGFFFSLGALAAVIFAYAIWYVLQVIVVFVSAFVKGLIKYSNKD